MDHPSRPHANLFEHDRQERIREPQSDYRNARFDLALGIAALRGQTTS
jgi:hypothetical protein